MKRIARILSAVIIMSFCLPTATVHTAPELNHRVGYIGTGNAEGYKYFFHSDGDAWVRFPDEEDNYMGTWYFVDNKLMVKGPDNVTAFILKDDGSILCEDGRVFVKEVYSVYGWAWGIENADGYRFFFNDDDMVLVTSPDDTYGVWFPYSIVDDYAVIHFDENDYALEILYNDFGFSLWNDEDKTQFFSVDNDYDKSIKLKSVETIDTGVRLTFSYTGGPYKNLTYKIISFDGEYNVLGHIYTSKNPLSKESGEYWFTWNGKSSETGEYLKDGYYHVIYTTPEWIESEGSDRRWNSKDYVYFDFGNN